MAKEGSTIGGLLDAFGAAISIGLQYGVPLERLVRKFAHERFEPSGFTKNPDIPIAKSIADYVFRWMACNFIPGYREANSPAPVQEELKVSDEKPKPAPSPVDVVRHALTDCPDCDQCGQPTVRNGACYKCLNCGNSMGCS